MKVEDGQRLERAERMMVRRMCGVTLKDRKSSEELRLTGNLGLELSVLDFLRKRRLKWFGHVNRKAEGDWVTNCQKWNWMERRARVGEENMDGVCEG